jgi:ribonuclease BN (tRNA processing enzyme)
MTRVVAPFFALSVSCACAATACGAARPAGPAPLLCRPVRDAVSSFELVVLGSGGPRGYGRAASSYLVVVDGAPRILVDAGPGAFVRLGELGVDFAKLDTVLLTHLHIDHSGDLPGFVKSRDLSFDGAMTFRIFGPEGGGPYPSTSVFVDRLFGERGAFAYLRGFRNTLTFEVADLPIDAGAPIHEVSNDRGLHVTSIAVDHGHAPAVAFRIEHAGHAVVVSGDLASKNDNLAHLAAGADLLVYDTTLLDPPDSPANLYDLHTSPKRIGEVAAEAHVKALLLSHTPPDVENAAGAVLRSVHASYAGPTSVAEDCLRVDLTK